jgi:pyruvate,water dikinase
VPKEKLIVWFSDTTKGDVAIVGGKGANLGEMFRAGIPVPDGFIVTAFAYFSFLKEARLADLIRKALSGLNPEETKRLNAVANEIQRRILAAPMSREAINAILNAYEELSEKIGTKNPRVAVRSSATAEDLPEASFAGQQATFLNVRGGKEVVNSVRRAWASLFEPRAIYYRQINKFDHLKVGIAVPVQQMVQSDKSGIMFTVDPVTGDKSKVVIEGGWGLGEAIVSGSVTPDRYLVDKETFSIVRREVHTQSWKISLVGDSDRHVKLSESIGSKQKLSDHEIIELAKLGLKLEEHYGFPQDVEWAIEEGKVYIVQTRPVTTLRKASIPVETGKPVSKMETGHAAPMLKGIAASIGISAGPVKIIHKVSEIGKIEVGDVLVTEMTNPSFVPAMRRAAAIVTDSGGQTSHAAIVSRELGIPAVVGTGKATSVLKAGMVITVDGAQGVVYKGDLRKTGGLPTPTLDRSVSASEQRVTQEVPVTATKIYVNLGEPFLAEKIAQEPVDGVGLLRAEFMIASLGYHPRYLVKKGQSKKYVDGLADGVETIARAFHPRPVIYRATDFKTNEYKNLKGGEKYEPHEENPMLGYRGAFRYIKEPDLFKLELDAILKVRDKLDLKNVHVMIPFVRTLEEFEQIREMMRMHGLKQNADFKLWIMVEVPSVVMMIEEFCETGIDGISFGSNDLTQLILGTDRDNQTLASEFDERHPTVIEAMRHVTEVCRKYGVTSSICGQAPSEYPEIVEKLIEFGITSLSVNPDAIVPVRRLAASIERKLLLRKIIENQNRHLK